MTISNINAAVELPAGFIRDGQTDASRLLVVNADGSINVDAIIGQPTSATTSGHTSSASQTHGSDTTAYTAGDVLGVDTNTGAAVEFTSCGIAGTDVLISAIEFEMDIAAIPSGFTSVQLALYNVTPPSALKDNAPWGVPSGDRAAYLGVYSFGSPTVQGAAANSTLWVSSMGPIAQVHLLSTSLFAYFITVGGYTPAAGTVRKGTIHTIQL